MTYSTKGLRKGRREPGENKVLLPMTYTLKGFEMERKELKNGR